MLLTYARAFTFAAVSIEYNRGQLAVLEAIGRSDPITDEINVGAATRQSLNTLRELCEKIPSLCSVSHPIDRILTKISRGVSATILHNELEGLQHRVMDELRGHFYFPVTASNAQLYQNPQPFGAAVYDAYPSARLDIMDATRCLIFDQATACAFHLMRALEVAMKLLAVKMKCGYSPSWEAYIKAIDKRLNRPYAEKSRSERSADPRFREILGDLTAIKLAWRNPTMHIERRYESHEALQVFVAASLLLERMANSGICERRSPRALAFASSETNDGS